MVEDNLQGSIILRRMDLWNQELATKNTRSV